MAETKSIPSPAKRWSADQGIPAEAQTMIAEVALAYVATVRPDGMPNLSPKATLKVIDNRTLGFADIASPATMANLEHNPGVEINIVDVFRRRGYRFRGQATIVDDPELIAYLGAGHGAEYPIRRAVRIAVEETRPLISPVYWVTDTSEEQVVEKWEQKLGYRRPVTARATR